MGLREKEMGGMGCAIIGMKRGLVLNVVSLILICMKN